MSKLPTQQRVHELFDYDYETGVLTWKYRNDTKKATWNTRYAGKPAGKQSDKNRTIGIDGKVYQLCSIVWLYCKGEPVPPEIDHEDRSQLNNRIDNLRPATRSQNNANQKIQYNNTSGFKGVKFHQNRWVAECNHNGTYYYLGRYVTLEAAVKARQAKFEELFGEFASHA